jgi:hypothetical protein
MKSLTNLCAWLLALSSSAPSAEPRQAIQDILLDDHTVYAVPVSGARVTTISFPGPISAIDSALATMDAKTPGLFQIAHTKGTSYFSTRALAKGAMTNVNVRWNGKTYVFELKESPEPWYSVVLQARDTKGNIRRPLTSARLLGLLDKAKAFPLLKQYHPDVVAGVDHREYSAQPAITDCGDYEIGLEEAFRFDADDTLIFRVTVRNKTAALLECSPERTQIKVGQRIYFPTLTDLKSLVVPNGIGSGYVALTGSPEGGRNDLSLRNDFTFILSRLSPDLDAAVRDFEAINSNSGLSK